MSQARFFAWVDLETTGLDEIENPIIEIGLVITEIAPPCRELDSFEAVILPADPEWEMTLNDQVHRMHTVNGLLEDVHAKGRSIRDVEHEILALLMKYGRPHNYMLAGSGVGHFDRRFIKAQMPGFDKWLQHPAMDVGVIRRMLKFCGRADLDAFGQTLDGAADKPHRGLPDVRDHINEYRQYASIIESLPKES